MLQQLAFWYDDVGRIAISHVVEVGVMYKYRQPKLQLYRVLAQQGNLSVYTTTPLGWT